MNNQELAEELGDDGKPVGVEMEPEQSITQPFDPKKISIDPKNVPMDTLLRRLRQRSIKLAPSFQRKYVWDQERKSRLIESLMLKIPLPMFYVAANEDGSWDVVDGLQRLTTIRDFILGDEIDPVSKEKSVPDARSFSLEKLEFWGELFDGKTFQQILNDPEGRNAKYINNILETELRFTVINPGTPEEVKRNIFKRINTGGLPLTTQEIRHALYQGFSTLLLENLSESDKFQKAVDYSINDSRMVARELILRFFAFYIHHREQFTNDMDKFLSNTMRAINELPISENKELTRKKIYGDQASEIQIIDFDIESLTNAFNEAMNRSYQIFGKNAFRKMTVFSERRTPINKALFDAIPNTLINLSESEFQTILLKKEIFIKKLKNWMSDYHFERAISRDSSSVSSADLRYALIESAIEETLKT